MPDTAIGGDTIGGAGDGGARLGLDWPERLDGSGGPGFNSAANQKKTYTISRADDGAFEAHLQIVYDVLHISFVPITFHRKFDSGLSTLDTVSFVELTMTKLYCFQQLMVFH